MKIFFSSLFSPACSTGPTAGGPVQRISPFGPLFPLPRSAQQPPPLPFFLPRGPSHAGLLRTPAPLWPIPRRPAPRLPLLRHRGLLWPSAPTPTVSTRKLFLSRCPAGPACQPDTLLPSSSFPFFPVLSFLHPSMAHTKTASHRITAPARKAPIS